MIVSNCVRKSTKQKYIPSNEDGTGGVSANLLWKLVQVGLQDCAAA